MAQSKRPVNLSVSKIRKEVPGNHLATAGSACVLEWPGDRASSSVDRTFLVTTSQVLSKRDLTSSAACTAEFLPLKSGNTEKFDLNNVPHYEKQLPDKNIGISLILIPTEELHKKKRFSRVRKNTFQSDRSQLCRSSKSEHEAANAKLEKLHCFVLCETASEGDKFFLQSYLLDVDECGSYFLQFHGNKSKLRALQDFHRSDRTESPIGSVILNNDAKVVGFLAYDEKDEIVPLFLPHDMKDCPKSTKGYSSEEGRPSDYSLHKETDRDANGNKEDNMFPGGKLQKLSNQVKNKDQSQGDSDNSNHDKLSETAEQSSVPLDDDDDDDDEKHGSFLGVKESSDLPSFEENLCIPGERSQPTEMSFESGSGRLPEEDATYSRLASQISAQDTEEDSEAGDQLGNDGAEEDAEHQNPDPIQRCFSEDPSTPRTKKKLLQKSKSESWGRLPLKSGALVSQFILNRAYIMDALERGLDTTYRKNVENWKHLADRQEVSDDVIMQLKRQSPESHSEALFQVLSTVDPNLSIGTLIFHLEDLKMKQLVTCLRNQQLNDEKIIDDLLESGNFPARFFILLDQMPEERWKTLGNRLHIDNQTLEGIKIDCVTQYQNPAEEAMELIYTSQPTMTIDTLKEKLKKIGREDITKRTLNGLPRDKYMTIRDLRNDLDLMREMTRMLNCPGNRQIRNYKDLARECGIPDEKYESLEPPCALSPTEEVIKDIVSRKPHYTVDELLIDLNSMDRKDVIDAISRSFKEEDVKALKEKLKISDK